MARTKPNDPELTALESDVARLSRTSQAWVLPIFAALAELGGSATPLAVEEHVRQHAARGLRPEQWAHVRKTKHIRWTRNDLRKMGALAGEKGLWTCTPLGERYWHKHRGDPPPALDFWPSLSPEELAELEAPLESVEVTSNQGYMVPVLRLLSREAMSKRDLTAALAATLRGKLLPGDYRVNAQGQVVYQYRTSWALTSLKLSGDVRNVSRAVWEITDAGRARLEREEQGWQLEHFHGSHAMARVQEPRLAGGSEALAAEAEVEDADEHEDAGQVWELGQWRRAAEGLGPATFAAVDSRLRPDLGPSPERPIPRNLIFFGPPGTGKTYAAMKIAEALTGEAEPSEDGRYRMVQFHPSYAYEDFIQGLRPDLKRSTLRYSPQLGPFAEICSDAEEDPERFFVLLVDEINRGDPARIFGEALFAIEHRGRPVGLASGGTLIVPPNLIVLGTMNSVDRSVALLDYALRRRFGFVYLAPDLALLRSRYYAVPKIEAMLAAIDKLNDWLRRRLGPEHVVGHSFFLNPAYPLDGPANLERIWSLDLEPLLAEYLVHDGEALQQLTREWKRWSAEVGAS